MVFDAWPVPSPLPALLLCVVPWWIPGEGGEPRISFKYFILNFYF